MTIALAFYPSRSDPVTATYDVELRSFNIADQTRWILHSMDVGLRLTWLFFVGSIDQTDQFTQLHHHRRDHSGMMNFHDVSRSKLMKRIVEPHPLLHVLRRHDHCGLPHQRSVINAVIMGTCLASAAHFPTAFMPTGFICTGRTGRMVAGRSDATGLSATGRTA